jgi:hypothetical protein
MGHITEPDSATRRMLPQMGRRADKTRARGAGTLPQEPARKGRLL